MNPDFLKKIRVFCLLLLVEKCGLKRKFNKGQPTQLPFTILSLTLQPFQQTFGHFIKCIGPS